MTIQSKAVWLGLLSLAAVGCNEAEPVVEAEPAGEVVRQALAACSTGGCGLDWDEELYDVIDVHAVDSDPAGNLYIVGQVEGGLASSSGYTTTPFLVGGWDGFVLAVDAGGSFLWGRRIGSPDDDAISDVSFNRANGGLYVTGYVSGEIPLSNGTFLPYAGGKDAFVGLLDATTGDLVTGRTYGAATDEVGYAIDTDFATGDVGIAGTFESTINITSPMFSAGNADIYVARLRPDLDASFQDRGGNLGDDTGFGVALYETLTVLVGEYQGDAAFDSGITLPSFGGRDLFAIAYDFSGTPYAAFEAGDGADDGALDVDISDQGVVMITGYYTGTVDLGGGPMPSLGGQEAFMARFDLGLNHICDGSFVTAGDDVSWDIAADDQDSSALILEIGVGNPNSVLLVVDNAFGCDMNPVDDPPGTGLESSGNNFRFGAGIDVDLPDGRVTAVYDDAMQQPVLAYIRSYL